MEIHGNDLIRPNMVAVGSELAETLIGGPCDGLRVQKTDKRIMYAGTFGSGIINVYERGNEGRLHFSVSIRVEK